MSMSSLYHFIRICTDYIVDGEQVEDREWALVNIGSLLEYGPPTAVLECIMGIKKHTSGGLGMSPTLPTSSIVGRMKVP